MSVFKKVTVVILTFVGFFSGSSRELLSFANEENSASPAGATSTHNNPDGDDTGTGAPSSG